jgi:3-oxoacyl-[acyl-carrier-protein] synthase III
MAFYRPRTDVYVSTPSVCLPSETMTNDDVLAWMGVKIKGNWITRRTGIEKRHWVKKDEAVSDIAVAAAEALLRRFPERRTEIRQLLLATVSGDYPTPPTSPLIQHRLGLADLGCFDLGAACAGFTTGLYTGAALCESTQETQLLIAAEIRSKYLNKLDLATTALFGDGAAACLIAREPALGGFRFIAGELLSDGSAADMISIQAGGSRLPHWQNQEPEKGFLKMRQGPALFMKAAQAMSIAGLSLLKKIDLPIEQVDWVVPHQANLHLMLEAARLMGVPREKMVETVQLYGNTSGASVGMALHYLCTARKLHPGQRIVLTSAGGGGLAASALLEAVSP